MIVRPGLLELREWLETRYVDTAGAAIQVDRRNQERRVEASRSQERERRYRSRRRPWSPAQAQAWRALGVVVIRVVPTNNGAVSDR
jgi:hypothetical protein